MMMVTLLNLLDCLLAALSDGEDRANDLAISKEESAVILAVLRMVVRGDRIAHRKDKWNSKLAERSSK